jgi:hypothetical protein
VILRSAVLFVFTIFQHAVTCAQEPPLTFSSRDSALASVIGNVSQESRLRIHIKNGQRVSNPKPRFVRDSVRIRFHDSTIVVAISEIDSVWVQRGTAARLLGRIAAAPCAVWGALAGHVLATDPDGGDPSSSGLIGTLVGASLGAVVCGAPGALVGSFIKRWRLVYPTHTAPNAK